MSTRISKADRHLRLVRSDSLPTSSPRTCSGGHREAKDYKEALAQPMRLIGPRNKSGVTKRIGLTRNFSQMSIRAGTAAAILILAGCSAAPQPSAGNGNSEFDNALAQASSDAEDDGRIVCAPAGNGAFSRQCTLDRV